MHSTTSLAQSAPIRPGVRPVDANGKCGPSNGVDSGTLLIFPAAARPLLLSATLFVLTPIHSPRNKKNLNKNSPSPTDRSIDRKGVYVELGAKSPAFCASSELSVARVERAADFVSPGDSREFVVIREDQRSGELQLSIRRAEEALVWRRLRQSLEEGAAVEGLVTSFNAAGLMVDVQGQKGFVPGSHVPNNVSPEDLVGRRLALKLLEVDEERQRLVLSNRRRASSSGGRTFRVGEWSFFPFFLFLFFSKGYRKEKTETHFFFSFSLSTPHIDTKNNPRRRRRRHGRGRPGLRSLRRPRRGRQR